MTRMPNIQHQIMGLRESLVIIKPYMFFLDTHKKLLFLVNQQSNLLMPQIIALI